MKLLLSIPFHFCLCRYVEQEYGVSENPQDIQQKLLVNIKNLEERMTGVTRAILLEVPRNVLKSVQCCVNANGFARNRREYIRRS